MQDFRSIIYGSYETKFNRVIDTVDQKSLVSLYKHYDKKILPFLKSVDKKNKILELGCGPGYLLTYLKNNNFENVLGIDTSEEQIKLAEQYGNTVIKDDIFNFFKTKQENFSIIFALDFIEHFTKNELIELFKMLYSHLDDKGTIILRTPNADGLFPNRIIYGDLTHLTILNENSIKQLCAITGFNDVVLIENSPIAKNLVGFIRLFFWKCIRMGLNFIKLIETGATQKIWSQDLICIIKK
jgi:2-polyprenyl-3-methyl-5-hydroxy-6-metoxy-1,4-benzoquinol methylase